MIDIHSHVLYGLDDGPRTLEESVAMVRMAAASGTTDLVATPHASPSFAFVPELVRERMAEVASAAGDVLRLHSGCDFHLTHDNIQDAIDNPRKYAINSNCYVLVEFSDLLIFHNTQDIFGRLQDAGMTPVITHPERNALLRQRLDQVAAWVASGALVQLTGQSLLGGFGRRARDFSRRLLDRKLVHFVASDGHDCEQRPPRLDLAYAWIKKNYSEKLAEALCVTNPRAVLTGAVLEPNDCSEVAPESRKWYLMWR